MRVAFIKTPIGFFKVRSRYGIIYSTEFTEETGESTNFHELLNLDLKNYFKGKCTMLDSRFKLIGTNFQKKVWREVMKIPYGMTKTYSEIAQAISLPDSYRAVANACGQNRLALFVPCHRVVGKNNLGGYKWGTDRKEFLLDLERTHQEILNSKYPDSNIINRTATYGGDLDMVEAEILNLYPNYYTYQVNISFPRCHKFVLYANPKKISKKEFEKRCDEIYQIERREASEY